jgi:Leucine-rich repeat (LRR) protein
MARAGVVDLSDMKLERVPRELLAVPKSCEGDASNQPLRCLILKNNRLVYLPSSLFACDASVDHNDLRKDDGSIPRCSDCEEGPLGGLRVLDVANNRLSTVPSAIACLASLTVLNLTSNRLTSLPPEIGPHSAARTHRTHRTHTHTQPHTI